MLARSVLATLLVLANLSLAQAASSYSWTAGICSSCGSLADLHCESGDNGAGVCDHCRPCDTSWSVSAEFLWLGRSRPDAHTLLVTDIGGLQLPSMDIRDLGFDTDGGVRTRIARTWESGRELEILYFGIYDQTGRQAINIDPATAFLNSVTYRFFGSAGGTATAYSAEYQSDLNSAEVNLRLLPRYGLTPLVGIRWLQLTEDLELVETATPTTGAFASVANDLTGLQVGLEADLWNRDDRLRIETSIKMGLYGNDIGLVASEQNAGVPFSALNRSFEQTSTVTEVRMTFVYRPCPYLAFRVGYSGLWMSDLATIGDQLSRFNIGTGAGALQSSTVGFHGGHMGFEWNW